jgi:hypothetical protein
MGSEKCADAVLEKPMTDRQAKLYLWLKMLFARERNDMAEHRFRLWAFSTVAFVLVVVLAKCGVI